MFRTLAQTPEGVNRVSAYLGIALLALLSSCRSEPITWRAPLHDVIFLNDTLSWADQVPDTLWTEGDQGLMLQATTRRSLLGPSDWLPSLDTSWSTTFTLPFIGGPIPVAPGAEIWAEQEVINLDLPDVELRRVRLGGGALSLSVSSTVGGALALRYRLEGAQFPSSTNGGSGDFEVLVPAGETAVLTVPLEGVEIDLTGSDGLQWNRLATSWVVGVPASASGEVGLFGSDELSLEVAFSGVELAQVEGRFDERPLALSEETAIGNQEVWSSAQVGWSGLEVDLDFHNTTGLDYALTLASIARVEASGDQTELVDDALGQTIFLPRAMVSGQGSMDGWAIYPTVAALSLGTGEDNLLDFMATVPESYRLEGNAVINPLGDVSGGFDRIDLTRLPEWALTVRAPLLLGPSAVTWVDTLRPLLPEGIGFQGELVLTVHNDLPLGAEVTMELVDLPESFQWLEDAGWPGEDWRQFDPFSLAPGAASSPQQEQEIRIGISGNQFDALRLGAGLRLSAQFATAEPEAQFDAGQRVVVRGHLQGDAIISIE